MNAKTPAHQIISEVELKALGKRAFMKLGMSEKDTEDLSLIHI